MAGMVPGAWRQGGRAAVAAAAAAATLAGRPGRWRAAGREDASEPARRAPCLLRALARPQAAGWDRCSSGGLLGMALPDPQPVRCESSAGPPRGEALHAKPRLPAPLRIPTVATGSSTAPTLLPYAARPRAPRSRAAALNRTAPGREGMLCPVQPSAQPAENCGPGLTCATLPDVRSGWVGGLMWGGVG